MKKQIITLIFVLGLAMGLNAQNDGFFAYSESGETNRSNSWGIEPALPTAHGLTAHQSAEAPLGSGLLILGALAIGYKKLKLKVVN